MSLGDTDIQGNANVSRNLTVGGFMRVQGDAEFGHGLKVKGYLEAPNIKGPNKGLFLTSAALREAYPSPEPGWWALVGNGFPASVYVAVPDGGWRNTGGLSGEVNIDGNGVVIGNGSSGESGSERVSDEEIERIGVVLEKDFLPVIQLEELDTLGTDGSRAAMNAFAISFGRKARYAVIHESWQIGVLELISDSLNHVLTEIFTTHEVLDPSTGSFTGYGHNDGEIWTYYRSFNLFSPVLPNERGTWTPWTIFSGRVPQDKGGKRFQFFHGIASKEGVNTSLAGNVPLLGTQLLYDPDFGFFLRIYDVGDGTFLPGIGVGTGTYHDYANWISGNANLGIPPKSEVGPNEETLYICSTGIWGKVGNTFMELMHLPS